MKVYPHVFLISIVVLTFAGCFARSLPDPFAQQREKELDKLIATNEKLRSLDTLCREIGAVQKFKIVRRSIAKDGSELYFYFEAGIPFLQISNNFATYFRENDWERQDRSRVAQNEFFRKGGLAVNIQYGGMGGGVDLGITCTLDSKKT